MTSVIVLLFVALGDANDPATRAVTRTTQEVLGENSVVLVREVATMPGDDRAVELEGALRASAVVELKWSAPDHREATVRVHTFRGTWTERVLTFAPSDAPAERGRVIAFAVAAMVPDEPPPPPPPPPPIAAPTPPPAPERHAIAVPEKEREPRVAVDVTAHLAAGARIEGRAIGGGVAVAWTPSWFGFRAAVSGRSGIAEVAGAAITTLRIAGGAMVARPITRWFSVGAHVDVGLLRLSAERAGAADARSLPYGVATVDVLLFAKRDDAFLFSFGIEHCAGPTHLVVAGESLGTLPRTRPVFELGARISF